jgi:regulatory protein
MEPAYLKDATVKLYRYCAYQERCHKEVKEKLHSLRIWGDAAEEVITHLVEEGFLNEERFAKAFALGKFRLKNWGRIKIVQELEQRQLSKHCIAMGLKEIDEADYRAALQKLISKKTETTEATNIYSLRDKIARYTIQKGFEPDLVWTFLKEKPNS